MITENNYDVYYLPTVSELSPIMFNTIHLAVSSEVLAISSYILSFVHIQ